MAGALRGGAGGGVAPATNRWGAVSAAYQVHPGDGSGFDSRPPTPTAEQDEAGGAEEPAGPRLVDADPVRRHLAALAAQGVGLNSVARLAGVSHGGLSKLAYGEPGRGRGPSRRVRPETARRVLAVTLDQASGGQRIDAGATWALVEELLAAGYTRAGLARQLGSRAASPSLQIGRRTVRASTARAVERLHARLLHR